MRKREIYIENFNTNSIKNMAYEPVVYHGQQAFLRSYIRIERAKRAMLLERQFKKGVFLESEGYFLNSSSRNIIAESEGTGKS